MLNFLGKKYACSKLCYVALFSIIPWLVGCHKNTTSLSTPENSSFIYPAYPAVHLSKYGIGCRSYEYRTDVGPPSFSLSDIGKPGVDALTPDRVIQAHRVEKYFKSKTLRFTLFFKGKKNEEFTIYDATQGPCPLSGVRYDILNQDGWQFYEPGENQFRPKNYPGDLGPSRPYPWITPYNPFR